jgi:transcriptional regulator with XRE-family HTH domain
MPAPPAVRRLLLRLRQLREKAGLTARDVEQRLILGPGWIDKFEAGDAVPPVDVLLAILHVLGASLSSVGDELEDIGSGEDGSSGGGIDRYIFAEPAKDGSGALLIRFQYANHDATYRLPNATVEQFDSVVLEMRNGLARLVAVDEERGQAVKTAAVAKTFLTAMRIWPHGNPSDLWTFVVSRLYYDPFNHPAQFSRLNLDQSWKRTGGWALEEIFVRHYGPFLKANGVNLFIASAEKKAQLLAQLRVADRIESDKADVLLTSQVGTQEHCFGVCHVKASFAERRTDDVPMSVALVNGGYCSPLITMDCKSGPSATPVNRGELGAVLTREGDSRSAKRKDIEDDGFFSACFSYNRNTLPTPATQQAKARIHVCDFSNPDDAFSRFVLAEWERFRTSRT